MSSPSDSPKKEDSSSESPSEETKESTPATAEETVPSAAASTPALPPVQSQWQAIWAPQYNSYYFFNPYTQETTWSNPLEPEASTSTKVPTPEEVAAAAIANAEAAQNTGPHLSETDRKRAALQAAAEAQGIDPLLAHLDPSLLASTSAVPSVPGEVPTFTAAFNAHTGKFAPANSRTPGHLSEHERAKRMSEFYFDVNQWEQDLAVHGGSIRGPDASAEEGGEEGSSKKRKRPTKKDLERFKKQKKLKKIAKTAWLRT